MQKARRRPCKVAGCRSTNAKPGRHISEPYPKTQRSTVIRRVNPSAPKEVMSLHDLPPPRKSRRLGLYLPFVIAVLLCVGWTAYWLWARGEARARLDEGVVAAKAAGYDVAWETRTLGGYPFRMNVNFTGLRIQERSGWAFDTPLLETQAYLLTPGHWMLATPKGLSFVRPAGGRVEVAGKLLHGSISKLGGAVPSFDFEGVDLTFQPGAGGQPFALTAAKRVEFHLRQGPDDEGGVFAKVEGGQARPASFLALSGQGKPVSLVWNSTLSRVSRLKGADWPGAVRAWSDAGGAIQVREAALTAGDAGISARNGTLTVGSDGRLKGALDATLRQGPRALMSLGQAGLVPIEVADAAALVAATRQDGGATAQATVYFQAGYATLGPVSIGASPKVYEVR